MYSIMQGVKHVQTLQLKVSFAELEQEWCFLVGFWLVGIF